MVNWDFTMNELVPGEPLAAPVQAPRCDGHQHAGWALLLSARPWPPRFALCDALVAVLMTTEVSYDASSPTLVQKCGPCTASQGDSL